jgi:hypothetical protein
MNMRSNYQYSILDVFSCKLSKDLNRNTELVKENILINKHVYSIIVEENNMSFFEIYNLNSLKCLIHIDYSASTIY